MHQGHADAREEQVELLRAVFDQAPGFMGLTRGSEHRFILANREFQRMTGRDPTGRTLEEALPELAAQGLGKMLDRVLETGEPYSARELRLHVMIDGRRREQAIHFTSQRLEWDGGYSDDVLCFGYDVTERVAAEQRARQLQHELRQTERAAAFGAMAATLAHEINQPLAAAGAYLAAARRMVAALKDERAGEAGETIALAGDEIQRAGKIVRQARRGLSEGLAPRKIIPLGQMVDDVLRTMAATGALGGIAVEISPEARALHLRVDRVQFEQVLVNVIRNAAEAMRDLEPKMLTVGAQRRGKEILIRVDDTGKGIEAGRDSFQAFSSSKGGMGLGLALSRTIVEAHGGRINVDNRSGGGASVVIALPADQRLATTESIEP